MKYYEGAVYPVVTIQTLAPHYQDLGDLGVSHNNQQTDHLEPASHHRELLCSSRHSIIVIRRLHHQEQGFATPRGFCSHEAGFRIPLSIGPCSLYFAFICDKSIKLRIIYYLA